MKRSSCATRTRRRSGARRQGRCPDSRAGRWVIRHGAGVTHFQHAVEGLEQDLAVCVAPDDPVKLSLLTLTNTSSGTRHLSVFGYVEWVLGPPAPASGGSSSPSWTRPPAPILARNAYNTEFKDRVAFWRATEAPTLADMRSCASSSGAIARSRRRRVCCANAWAGELGAGWIPARRLQIADRDSAGRVARVSPSCSDRAGPSHAAALAARLRALGKSTRRSQRSERFWDDVSAPIQVQTPDDSFDLLVNRWLLYQALSLSDLGAERPTNRAARSDSAISFRMCCRCCYARPDLCRSHILLRGVAAVRRRRRPALVASAGRTRHPNAMLRRSALAAYVAASYVARTGDHRLLDEVVPFLQAPPLEPDSARRTACPRCRADGLDLRACDRAIDRSLKYGAHGLPLIGSGDWNDGMNRVGARRAWRKRLARMVSGVVLNSGRRSANAQAIDRAQHYRSEARWLTGMLELAWDGNWYRRAYFDDGTPLGSAQNEECRIDSLTQSWAVFSQEADRTRAARAMEAVRAQLVRRDAQVVLLLTPPFDRMAHDPGYIKGYLPGVRENGGQYTHAACGRSSRSRSSDWATRHGAVPHGQPDQSHAHASRPRAVPRRTVRRGRRCLCTSDAPGSRRVELVHGVSRLDVPGGDRRPCLDYPVMAVRSAWNPAFPRCGRSSHSVDRGPDPVPHCGSQSRPSLHGRQVGTTRWRTC